MPDPTRIDPSMLSPEDQARFLQSDNDRAEVANEKRKPEEERKSAEVFVNRPGEDVAERSPLVAPVESNEVATEKKMSGLASTQTTIEDDTSAPDMAEIDPAVDLVGNDTEKQSNRDYEIFDSEGRYFLVSTADKMIDWIKDKQYDRLIFLDAGARLVGYLIRERWKHTLPDIPVPQISFIKIGQEMGHDSGFGSFSEMPNVYDHPVNPFKRSYEGKRPSISDIIERYKINKRFNKLAQGIPDALSKKSAPDLQGKKILIVDDFTNSGNTLQYSKKMFQQAYPDSVIDTNSFTGSGTKIPKQLGNPYAGLRLPRYPAFQGANSLILQTRRPSDYQEEIDELEQQLPLLEEDNNKHLTPAQIEYEKSSYERWGDSSSLSGKFWESKKRLDKLRSAQESIKKQIKRYTQALREIHWMAKE